MQFGTAYEGLDMRKGKIILVHIFMFYLRRALLAVCAIYIMQNLAIQIAVLFSTTLLQIALISGFKVYKDNSRNKSEIINETIAMLIMYGIFLFTDFVPDIECKLYLGHLFSGFILTHLFVNICLISARSFTLSTRKWFAKRELKINL